MQPQECDGSQLWANYRTFLGLSFLICETGVKIVAVSGMTKGKWGFNVAIHFRVGKSTWHRENANYHGFSGYWIKKKYRGETGILNFCQQPSDPLSSNYIGLSPDFKLLGTILSTFNQLLLSNSESCVHGKNIVLPYLRAASSQISHWYQWPLTPLRQLGKIVQRLGNYQ